MKQLVRHTIRQYHMLPDGARVRLTRSPLKVKLLATGQRDFFSVLNRKLNWGAR